MLGDVGGVLEILMVMFRGFAYPFAILRMKAIITSKLFHLSADNRQSLLGKMKLSE
jgi:hypothetical protein